jgi:TolA-binding protein
MTLEFIMQQITMTNTGQEREDARQLLKHWVSTHPDDHFAPDLFYLLDCMEEEAIKSAAFWEVLQVKLKTLGAAELSEDEVVRIGLSARSLAEIAHARQVLHEWEQAHPDERKMHGVYEQMYILEDGQEAQIAEPVAIAA